MRSLSPLAINVGMVNAERSDGAERAGPELRHDWPAMAVTLARVSPSRAAFGGGTVTIIGEPGSGKSTTAMTGEVRFVRGGGRWALASISPDAVSMCWRPWWWRGGTCGADAVAPLPEAGPGRVVGRGGGRVDRGFGPASTCRAGRVRKGDLRRLQGEPPRAPPKPRRRPTRPDRLANYCNGADCCSSVCTWNQTQVRLGALCAARESNPQPAD
jgi:hypothetical protein